MTRRALTRISTTAMTVIALCGCQSASIRMERHSSGGADRDFEFEPAVGPDHHYITFPAHPFVNCFDTIQADSGYDQEHPSRDTVGSPVCRAEKPVGSSKEPDQKKEPDQDLQPIPCDASAPFQG